MSVGGIAGALPPQLVEHAVRLVFDIIGQLHAVSANANGVLFALAASPQLADDLAVFGVRYEDDEADGSDENDHRSSPTLIARAIAPAPLQGYPVPPWGQLNQRVEVQPSRLEVGKAASSSGVSE